MIAKLAPPRTLARLCFRGGQDWEGNDLAQDLFWGFPSALPLGGSLQELGHCAWSMGCLPPSHTLSPQPAGLGSIWPSSKIWFKQYLLSETSFSISHAPHLTPGTRIPDKLVNHKLLKHLTILQVSAETILQVTDFFLML